MWSQRIPTGVPQMDKQWSRWMEGVQGCSRSSVWSSRAASCLLFSMSSLWSPCSVGLGMRGQIRPCAVSLWAGPLKVRVPAFADNITVFASHHLGIEAVKKAVGEYELIAGVKVILTKAKVCSSVLGLVAILFQGPSAGATNLSASSRCGSGSTSNWSEIGRKYKLSRMLRWEPSFQGGCP